MKPADHYRISQTAILCADVRAFCTAMPYAPEIFAEVAANSEGRVSGLLPNVVKKAFLALPVLRASVAKISLLEGRYYATNEAVNQRLGARAPILEVAAGLSTRGLHLSESRWYFETDLVDLIRQKQRITAAVLKRRGQRAPATLAQQALDALDYTQLSAATAALREREPTAPFAILHEGLLMYFDDAEQARFRDHVRRLLSEFNPDGAWITTDFALRQNDRGMVRRLMGKLERRTGRRFNCFGSDAAVRDFLHQGGLRVDFLPNEHIARGLSCIDRIGLRAADVLRHAADYRAAVITLA